MISESTEFLLYRGDIDDQKEYENDKLSFRLDLRNRANLITVYFELKALIKDLDKLLETLSHNTEQMEKYEIEYNKDIVVKKNQIQDSYYKSINNINDMLQQIDEDLQAIVESSRQESENLKQKLRECLQKNLNCEDILLNSIFSCKNVYELMGLFTSEAEFLLSIKENKKVLKKIDPMTAYRMLARVAAVKAVDPTITDDARNKQEKENLKKVKTCIDLTETSIKSYISDNMADVKQYDQIKQEIEHWVKALEKLNDPNQVRMIAEKEKELLIQEKAKEPPQERDKPGKDQAITASLLQPK